MASPVQVQTALRARLISKATVTNLVPAANIYDGVRPERFPCVLLGEEQVVPRTPVLGRMSDHRYRHADLHITLHVFAEEPGTIAAKTIATAVKDALHDELTISGTPVALIFESSQMLRDPGGKHSHAVLNFWAIIFEEVA